MTIKDDAALITEWIEANPYRPGPADVRIKGYGNSVWAIIGDLPACSDDAAALAEDFELPVESVEAAKAYYRRHRAVIDARLAANWIAGDH